MSAAPDAELQSYIRQTTEHYWQQAEKLHPRKLKRAGLPAIRFDLSGSSAGQVQFIRRAWKTEPTAIRFNLQIARQNPHSIDQTIAHEVAHAVAVVIHGRKGLGHGSTWKGIMAHFGKPADRCHDYDLSEVKVRRQRRFVYHCACPEEQLLTTVRHNRQQNGQQHYFCRRCKRPLHFSGREQQAQP